MKKNPGAFLFALAVVLFLIMVWHYSRTLPEKIVGHFNESGKASPPMATSTFLLSMTGMAILLPALVSGILYPMRFLSPKLLNTPYPEYWRKPENFRKACDLLLRSAHWFNAAFVVWTTGLMCLVVAANEAQPHRNNEPHCFSHRRLDHLDCLFDEIFHAETRIGLGIDGHDAILRRCRAWAKDSQLNHCEREWDHWN